MSHLKALGYSFAVLLVPFLGLQLGNYLDFALGRLLDAPSLQLKQEAQAILALLCLIFVLRLPKRSRLDRESKIPRALLLLAPLPCLIANVAGNPVTSFPGATILLIALIDCISIGVYHELVFRFHLHRIWSRYSNAFYLLASSLLFGLIHYPRGVSIVIVASIVGMTLGLARIGGMPRALSGKPQAWVAPRFEVCPGFPETARFDGEAWSTGRWISGRSQCDPFAQRSAMHSIGY